MVVMKSIATQIPKSLVIEDFMIDVNQDIEEVNDEEGNKRYEYTTYRFRNIAEFASWLNEQTNNKTLSLSDRTDLLEECVVELAANVLGE